MQEFPFLEKIISLEQLEAVFTQGEKRLGGFLVRRPKYDFFFETTDNNGDTETWVAYTSKSVAPNHVEPLPPKRQIWEVFPYEFERLLDGIGPTREFIAVVQLVKHDGKPTMVIVFKLPKPGSDWYAFQKCLENIRRIARWPRWKVYNHEPHPDNVAF